MGGPCLAIHYSPRWQAPPLLLRCLVEKGSPHCLVCRTAGHRPLGIVTGRVNPRPVRVGYWRVRVWVDILLPVKNPYPSHGYRGYRWWFNKLGLTFNATVVSCWSITPASANQVTPSHPHT